MANPHLLSDLDNDTRDFSKPYMHAIDGLTCPCGGLLYRVRTNDGREIVSCLDIGSGNHYWVRVDGEYVATEAPQ